MNFQEIELFLAIVEKKNISKAAASLFMSQSTLSHRLNMFEKELNLVLFERKRGQRTMEMTPQGIAFLDIAERWIALWKETQRLHLEGNHQRLVIGGVASLNEYLFLQLFHRLFVNEDPKIKLMIRSTQSSALYPALENHEIDVGFSVQPAMYSNIYNQPILSEEEILVVHGGTVPDGRLFGGEVHPRDLDPEKEVLFHFHPDYMHWHNYWWDYFTQPLVGIGDAYLVETFLNIPGSWAILPMSLALAQQKRGNVSLHRLSSPPPDRICYMLKHRIPRPGKEKCYEALEYFLDEFLRDEEQKGTLKRL